MKRIKKIFSFLFRLIYFIALTSLFLSYFAPPAHPKNFWMLSFFGLAYPALLLANIFFLIWWLIRWKKLYWLSLIVLLIGWTNMKTLFHFSASPPTPLRQSGGESSEIKVLSFNVRLFDLYNWTHNKETRQRIFSFLKEESADILCLQEFFQGDSGYFETLVPLVNLTQAKDKHVEYTITLKKKHHWGIATFSKYPIVNRGAIRFKTRSNNICIWSDIKTGEDTVRVYNLHLQSISFGASDYKFMEALRQKSDTLDREDIEMGSKNILRRLKRAFIRRASQTEKVIQHIDSCRYPVIVCGDFNDSPFSYTYHCFAEELKDAFMESGSGFGTTYLGSFPSYRIDYIFHSTHFTSSDFETVREELSDHYPVKCRLKKADYPDAK